jgi:hypothetical protein
MTEDTVMYRMALIAVAIVCAFQPEAADATSIECPGTMVRSAKGGCMEIDSLDFQVLKNDLPDEKRGFALVVYNDLLSKSDGELYDLRIEPCASPTILNCHGLTAADVKRIIDNALERNKAIRSAQEARLSRYISLGGFGLSVLSLLVSFLSFRQKKGEAAKDTQDTAATTAGASPSSANAPLG